MAELTSSVAAALTRWRDNLIDLTRRNPLISVRPTRASLLELSHPKPSALWQRLIVQGKACTFWLPPAEADKPDAEGKGQPLAFEHLQTKPGEIVCGDLPRQDLLRALTNLYRRARAEFRERGLHILFVAFGALHWRDKDNETFRSPLVLAPVELERASLHEPFKLRPSEDEPVVNSALAARLGRDFNFQLPAPPELWDESDIAEYLRQVEAAIAGLPGWKVETTACLALFSFFKGVIYRDLEDNAGLAEAHPLVRALAGERIGEALTPTPLPCEDELDAVQTPDKTFTILDADASQRVCLEAAARGHSFVLHGPPGTGKSQTIANLIAQSLAVGKKVLFVSEKMAALEVVYSRLREAGLADFCLELHSHKANKRAVVQELSRCLGNEPPFTGVSEPGASVATNDFGKLQQRGAQLTRFVHALHEPREPMQRSAWWALGELIRCSQAPAICSASGGQPLKINAEVNSTWLDEARQAVQRAQQLWPIAEQGSNYIWWGFKVGDRYTLKLRDEIVGLVEKTKKQLERLLLTAEQYSGQIGANGSVAWLLRIGELLNSNPHPPSAWLTTADFAQLADDLERCAEDYLKRGKSREPLTQRYGASVWKLREGTAAGIEEAWHATATLLAPGDDKGSGLLTRQQQLRGWAADTQKRIPSWLADAKIIEKWLAVDLPRGEGAVGPQDPSVHWLKRLMRLAHLCESEHAPERHWVLDPSACAAAKKLVEINRPVFANYHQGRLRLLQTYIEQFFELDLERIAAGFAGPYQSWLRFLNMEFRRDRRAIARRSKSHQMPLTAGEDVGLARDLVREKARLESEQPTRSATLGRYEKGLQTDFDAAERATRIAEEAVALVQEFGHEQLPAKFVDALSAAGPPPEKIRAAMKRLQDSLGAWWHATEEQKNYLPMDALPSTSHPLDEIALSALLNYAKSLQASLNHFATLADAVLSPAKSPPPDAATLVADLREVELLQKQEASQQQEDAKWAERFGSAFQGLATDWTALRRKLTWTQRVREHFAVASPEWQPSTECVGRGNFAPPAAFVQLASSGASGSNSTKDLRHAWDQFQHALHSLEIRFERPGPLVDGKRLAVMPLDQLKKRLAEMQKRAGELSDWSDWHYLGKRFEHLGLADFWTDLQKAQPPRNQLVDAFLKSALTSWLDQTLLHDPALREFRRQNHERILQEFRDLDRRLLQNNASRVGAAAATRRPHAQGASPGGEIALLMREAHKKTRHLSVRRLFEEIPALLLQLKPCMLMSPLSVSQFLDPAKIQFDLVVFDEASQICPEDAVGAMLRGKQVVVTGDDKQLPPTNFFQQQADDGDDFDDKVEQEPAAFESVLDACLGAGMQQHFLRWHYRSRREGLIAYSNRSFYDNRLITFPGPAAGAAAVGVQFHYVANAVYDRGGTRDNPREAQAVADLVMDHFRRHGERKTLGVIAFSQAQMYAIEDEIENRLRQSPDLEPLFQSDRLGGFFVKNLETVQGDERDVILLSVGYGRDADGRFTLHFGPVNREGGQRRLNVAVTRAREQLIVISSIRASDLDLTGTKAEGVHHLHRYLDFAERGLAALEGTGALPPPEPLTALEADVMQALQDLGYNALPHVGCGGHRIDLAVIDHAASSHFLLGVECDGVNYNGTPTARDRDRLRAEVLEKLGWRLHRIWAMEWLQRREQEVQRLKEALDEARAIAARRELPSESIPPPAKKGEATHVLATTKVQDPPPPTPQLVGNGQG